MSILITRLPEKKWEDISIEDVNKAIVFDDSEETGERFCEEDVEVAQLGAFGIKYIPSTYDDFNADQDSITTLFAGIYATAVYIPGCKEEETVDALRTIAWDFVAATSGRSYACNDLELKEAIRYIGYSKEEWIARVGRLAMAMILGL